MWQFVTWVIRALRIFGTQPMSSAVSAKLPCAVRDVSRWKATRTPLGMDSGDYTLLVGRNAADAETSGNRGTVTIDGD